MRKSSLFLLLVVEILALFIFENMRALFTTLERNERQAIIAHADLQAEMHILLALRDGQPPGQSKYFDRVSPLRRGESGQQIVAADNGLRLEIRKPVADGRGLLFSRTVRSPQLRSFQGMKKVLSLMVLFLGLAIAASSIYFMVLLRRKKTEPAPEAGSPLQDYLVDLKSAQLELQDLVASQQRASSAQEQLNKSIINNARLGMIYLSADGRVEIFNPAAQELFGRGFAAVKNQPLAEALPDHAELAEFILAGDRKRSAEFENGPSILAVDVVPVGAGRDGPVATGDNCLRGGDSRGRLALIRDVSDERKRERVRRQKDNLLMLGEMAASLAHEVRNSLGVILGYTKAMSGEPEKTAKVIREVQFVTEMMESFLRFARPVEKIARRPVDLGALIAAAAAAHDLAGELPAGRLELQSDPLLLNVVFGNLALNARQAGAKSLRVEFPPGDVPNVILADDGRGISAANADKIWLPFFTSRDKGTGMGLATVKKIAGALGADIQLLNPGEPGARFRITFYS